MMKIGFEKLKSSRKIDLFLDEEKMLDYESFIVSDCEETVPGPEAKKRRTEEEEGRGRVTFKVLPFFIIMEYGSIYVNMKIYLGLCVRKLIYL